MRRRAYSIYNILMACVLIAPIAVAVAVSFNPGRYMKFPPDGLSLRWFSSVLASEQFMSALWFSVQVAAVVTVLGLLISVPAALALIRSKRFPRAATRIAALTPLVVPEILLALGLLILFNSQLDVGGGFAPIVLGHVIVGIPLGIQVLTAGLSQIDQSVEQAAWTLGASRPYAFLTVTLPQVMPSILGSGLFMFIVSFDNINISLFMTKPGQVTLPIQMYEYLNYRADPTVAAMSTLLVAAGVGAFVIASKIGALRHLGGDGGAR